jgi:Bacterial SH3 domain
MRHIDGRAACRRGLACVVTIVLCFGPTVAGVHAQETPAGGPATIASSGEAVLLREQPGYNAAVLTTLGDGSPLEVIGGAVTAGDGTSWLPAVAGGQSGYVPAGYVSTAPVPEAPADVPGSVPVTAPEPVAASSMTSASTLAPAPDPVTAAPGQPGAATTTAANLHSGPSADAGVLAVLPPGTSVSVDGAPSNRFVPVTGNGIAGWIAVDLLAGGSVPAAPLPAPVQETAVAPLTSDASVPPSAAAPAMAPVAVVAPEAPAPAPAVASSESTGIAWPFSGGEWEVVQGYNNGTHTNRSGFAQYKYSLDWARVDGDTAGQPVFAPVSGSVRWVDRGSGGMLIDAGNGYGVAVFHVTIDHGLARGGSVERGQRIGTISGPGGDGFMSMAHIDITVWRLVDGGHEAVPFVGPNAIAGQEFPDTGGANQHMGARVTP